MSDPGPPVGIGIGRGIGGIAVLDGVMNCANTLIASATARQEIRKSRFVAVAGPISDEAGAKAFVATCTQPTASHNCWAWRIGQTYRFSDDGEPAGTAGKPILQAIDGQSIDRVAVVVTRWFGGVLLGSGGLIRAYGGTAAICLRQAAKVVLVDTVAATIECPFSDLSLVQARLEALPNVEVSVRAFTETGATLAVSIAHGDVASVSRLVADLTSGRAVVAFDT